MCSSVYVVTEMQRYSHVSCRMWTPMWECKRML